MTYNQPLLGIFKNYVKRKILFLDVEGLGIAFLISAIIDQRNKFLVRVYRLVRWLVKRIAY